MLRSMSFLWVLIFFFSAPCKGKETGGQWQGGWSPKALQSSAPAVAVSNWLLLDTGGTGGAHHLAFKLADVRGKLLDVAFWRDGRHGAACGSAGAFYTSDGGLTWKRIKNHPRKEYPDTPAIQYYQVELSGPEEIWLAEGRHPAIGRHLWHSTDAGQTWEDVTKRLPGEFKSIWDLIVRGKQIWLLGGWDPEESYHSRDGGKTWQKLKLPHGFEPFRLVTPANESMEKAKTVYMLGALKDAAHRYPQLFFSDDGGKNWIKKSLPTPKELPWRFSASTLAFASSKEGIIGLEAKGLKLTSRGWEKESEFGASVLVTSDGGDNWVRRDLPNHELRISALWLNPERPAHGIASVWNKYVARNYGARGGPALYETFDMGKTWSVVIRGKPHINSIFGLDSRRVWAVGNIEGHFGNDLVAILDASTTSKTPGSRKIAEGHSISSQSFRNLSMLEKRQQLLYSTEGPVKIEYELSEGGYVTLVIEKEDGTRVRNLIGNYPRKRGKNIDFWNGRDDSGNLLSIGKYRVRGLYHGELDVLYEFSYGTPGNPPWETTDSRGGWLANHTNPIAIFADEERIYVAASWSEGPHPLIALDYEGNKLWGNFAHGHAGFMARHGQYLYVINDLAIHPYRFAEKLQTGKVDGMSKIELIRINPKTGSQVPFPDGKSKHVIAKWNIQKEGASKKWEGWTNHYKAHDADWVGINAQGLAAMGKYLYASLHFSNKLLKIDAEKGELVKEIPLASPAGLVSDGKQLLAISEKKVVKVLSDGTFQNVIRDGLKAPIALALDQKGNIYVSDWADQMNVKVFSPTGKYLRHIGKLGGRSLVGPYDASGMFLPRGISIDAKGRLWVAEDDFSPRRISAWNQDGTLALEKVGNTLYGGMGTYIFPDEPDKAFLTGNLVELDWEKARWKVMGTPWRALDKDASLGLDRHSEISGFRTIGDRRFLIHTSNKILNGVTTISEWRNHRAKPLVAIGSCTSALVMNAWDFKSGFEPIPAFAEHLWAEPKINEVAKKVMPWYFHGPIAGNRLVPDHYSLNIWQKSGLKTDNFRPNCNFVWHDLNGDGLQDQDEMSYYTTPKLKGIHPKSWGPEYWSHGVVDKNLSIYLSAFQNGKSHHFRLSVSRWAKSGVPIYEPEKATLIVASPYLGEVAWVNQKGQFLAYGNMPNPKRNKLRDPLVMFNPDGSIAWSYPSDYTGVRGSHTAPQARNGLLIGPLGVFGEANLEAVGGIFAFHTNMGQAVIFTEDGLYLGELFKDDRSVNDPLPNVPQRGMSVMNTSPGGEWFGGQLFQNPKNNNIYVVGIGGENGGIGRVTGLETTKRLPIQIIDFTRQDYFAAAKLLESRVKAETETVKKVVTISALKKTVSQPPPASSFTQKKGTTSFWRFDENRSAEATWMYDKSNLYVYFKNVTDKTPMINSGEDVQLLFKFGDAALLELRTVANNMSDSIIPGDMRILFSVYQGKPTAVLYNYKVNGVTDPVHFTTSVKDVVVDVVKVLEKAKVIIDRKPEGYSLRASIPLQDLNFTPLPGKRYKGDFSIVHSDERGMTNTLRMSWANEATGLVNDLAHEADITPKMWGWFELE